MNGYPQSEIDKRQGRGVPCTVWGEIETDPARLLETQTEVGLRCASALRPIVVVQRRRRDAWKQSFAISDNL
jgi:hypothetical protein